MLCIPVKPCLFLNYPHLKMRLIVLHGLTKQFNNPDGSKPQGYEKADINGDGVINTVDFSLMRVIYIGKGKIKELLR